MPQVALLLGSNINKERNLPAAVRLLADAVTIEAVSPVYETEPATAHKQPPYFNAAVLIHTSEPAARLKDGLLKEIEQRLGRVRTDDKNAPRTIDLDITLYGDAILQYVPADGNPRHIPDPDLLRFAHCALPIADLLPEMTHPETGEPLRMIADRLLALSKAAIRLRVDFDLETVWKKAGPPTG